MTGALQSIGGNISAAMDIAKSILPLKSNLACLILKKKNRKNEKRALYLPPVWSSNPMQLSIEGPGIPDVRDCTAAEHRELKTLIVKAYETWLEQPRRLSHGY